MLHDDAEREFAYVAGAEKALDEAKAKGWTVVSIRDDWITVFGDSRLEGRSAETPRRSGISLPAAWFIAAPLPDG